MRHFYLENENKRIDETALTWKTKAVKLKAENNTLKKKIKEIEEKLAAVQVCIICNNVTVNNVKYFLLL